jgi:hypothetical protein
MIIKKTCKLSEPELTLPSKFVAVGGLMTNSGKLTTNLHTYEYSIYRQNFFFCLLAGAVTVVYMDLEELESSQTLTFISGCHL